MCGETRIPKDMCAGNTIPGETHIIVTPVILVNVYMLSVQVMKRTIKLLPLLGRHLASRVIKQLNEHITTAVLNTGRRYNT